MRRGQRTGPTPAPRAPPRKQRLRAGCAWTSNEMGSRGQSVHRPRIVSQGARARQSAVTGAAPVRRGGQGAAIIEPMDTRWKPSVTVAAIIERDGRFLLVEEETAEGLMLNNPAGHLEPGESPAQGCARETLEETGHRFLPRPCSASTWCGHCAIPPATT